MERLNHDAVTQIDARLNNQLNEKLKILRDYRDNLTRQLQSMIWRQTMSNEKLNRLIKLSWLDGITIWKKKPSEILESSMDIISVNPNDFESEIVTHSLRTDI